MSRQAVALPAASLVSLVRRIFLLLLPTHFLFPGGTISMAEDARTLYDAVVSELTATSEATTAKMFGMPCLKINGKAFAGFYQESMVFKLQGDAHASALALPGSVLFDPSGRARPMKEWVVVRGTLASTWVDIGRQSLAYVRGGAETAG